MKKRIKNILFIIICFLASFGFEVVASEVPNNSATMTNLWTGDNAVVKPKKLKGMSASLAMGAECRDIKAMGMTSHLCFDYARPVSQSIALGLYVDASAGFLSRVHPYSSYDQFMMPFKFSLGFLMEFGDLLDKPYIFGIAPCSGLGFVDMDLVLPLEVRFGKFINKVWYLAGEFTLGVSLAKETVYIEPGLRIGYNFKH